MSTNAGVNVIEWGRNVQEKGYDNTSGICIKNKYYTHISKCLAYVSGIVEKSFIAITNNQLKLLCYDFNGKILHTFNISKEISKKVITNGIKLYLNSGSFKLLIQMKRHLIFYSFEQRKVILQKTLEKSPTSFFFLDMLEILLEFHMMMKW